MAGSVFLSEASTAENHLDVLFFSSRWNRTNRAKVLLSALALTGLGSNREELRVLLVVEYENDVNWL